MKRDADQIRETVRKKVETADIFLWGCEDAAKAFYQKYRDIFHIKGGLTELRCHPDYLDDEQTVPIMEWKDYQGGANDYIVVFSSPFVHVETQMLANGLQIFEEYIEATVLEVFLTDKKIAIMAGNCQMAMTFDFIREVKGFTDEYHVFRFASHYWKSRWSLKTISYLHGLCDLYICIRHDEEDLKFFSREELPETCRIVVVPSLLVRLYWPQMKANREKARNEYFLTDKSYKTHGPFEYGDANINRMIKEGKDIEEIVAALTAEDFYTEEQVRNHINMMMRMLEYEEDGCDIKMSSYIKERYTKQMLYRDMTHMQMDLVWEVVKRILECIGMDAGEVEAVRQDADNPACRMYKGHCTEVPVYPSVAKHLGLEWCNKDTLYDIVLYNGIRKMTFEEYIYAYYSVCNKIKQLREEW
ncbi:MAG: hypothetical protein J6C84_07805 [Lachnospiraceae bacterium]|nr:hypothetical protein [Lachnospiraceae bacterium]